VPLYDFFFHHIGYTEVELKVTPSMEQIMITFRFKKKNYKNISTYFMLQLHEHALYAHWL
jgi:hypothetical protein